MIKIMFVCHGNICRSPIAEILFNNLIKENHLENQVMSYSSATSYEEIGNPIYPPAKKILKKHNIPFCEHYAQKLYTNDYDKYDYFIVMDENNLYNIKRIFPNDTDNKIHKLLSFLGSNADVSDPYYSGNFDRAFDDINIGCKALFENIKNQL